MAIRPVAASELCVSSGHVNPVASHLHVDSGAMRAVIAGDMSDTAEVDFVYGGASRETTPLASGELRRQIGLKLRAKDTCNVVYVMWHVEPTPGIAVLVKRNPGASTHQQCADRGYVSIRPTAAAAVPHIVPNERHVLRAEIHGDVLRVLVDRAVAWTGTLPPEALTLEGPAGIRTDNGVFDLDLSVARARAAGANCR